MNRIMNLAMIAATGLMLNCRGPEQVTCSDAVVLLNSNSTRADRGIQKLIP